MQVLPLPLNLKNWIEKNKHHLKPPVGNKCIWQNADFIVMVVGGPNNRKDYHYNETPEFFYQLKGAITLKVIDQGTPKDLHIQEGDVYLLPPKVPHLPQRGPNTLGLVIESKRPEGVQDALLWYCENCKEKLYEATFYLKTIETDLPQILNSYYSDLNKRTCPHCGTIMAPPAAM